MGDQNPRDFRTRPVRRPLGGAIPCAPWAVLLPDAAEGLLSDAEQRALDQHLAGCRACSEEFEAAQRGLAWLTVLKDQTPEPPVNLLASILAQTTGCEEAGVMLPAFTPVSLPLGASPFPAGTSPSAQDTGRGLRGWLDVQGAWSSIMQPRLAMTAAMAFFSICVTLNLLGISVSNLDAQTMRRGGLHRTVTNTGASLLRSFEGLRVVYRVESRVNEMRAQTDDPHSLDH